MAMIAIPRFQPPRLSLEGLRGLASNPYAGVGAAGALLIVAAATLVSLVGPAKSPAPGVRVPLAQTLRHAPPGWRQALKTSREVIVTEDLVRLSERPIAPTTGESWNTGARALPAVAPTGPLPASPLAGFYAPGPGGPLPIIGPGGRTPFQVYSRPFVSNGRPKIALVIGGLGLDARRTQMAIESLPGPITLSFSPYAEGLQGWVDMARQHGHEVLLETPMEPQGYPDNDAGPYTLMTDGTPAETSKKLEWILSRATGYFGLTNYLGSRFLGDEAAYEGFAAAARSRGLGFIDDGSASRRTGGLPRATADRVIDDQLSQKAIDQQLLALEAGAQQHGHALGAGFAYPVTLEKVAHWSAGVEARGYQLAPASALAAKK